MFVYSVYFKAKKVALVYPGNANDIDGTFEKILDESENRICNLIFIPVKENIKEWQKEIANRIISYIDE